jgi:hypothetical protein
VAMSGSECGMTETVRTKKKPGGLSRAFSGTRSWNRIAAYMNLSGGVNQAG